MAIVWSDFESGTNGATATTANTGVATILATGGTAVISTVQAKVGTRSVLLTGNSTSAYLYLQDEFIATTQLRASIWMYYSGPPPADNRAIIGFYGDTTRGISVNMMASGRIILRDGAGGGGTNIWYPTDVLATGWYRLSLYATQDATAGTCGAALYNSANALISSSGNLTSKNTGSVAYNSFRFGTKHTVNTDVWTLGFDYAGFDTANGTALLDLPSGAPTTAVTGYSPVAVIDATASSATSGGALSFAISPTTGVVQIATGIWKVPVPVANASAVTYTVTTIESGGGTSTGSYTVNPSAGTSGGEVTLTMVNGSLV